MRHVIILLFLILAINVNAKLTKKELLKRGETAKASKVDPALNMSCVTNMPTTSMFAETTGEIVTFSMSHHNGIQYAPVFNGNITTNDFPIINQRAQIIHQMGESFSVEFDKARCNEHGELNYDCFSSATKVIGSVELHNFAVQTYPSVSYLYGYEFIELHVIFSARTATNEQVRTEMVYDMSVNNECTFN